MDSACICGEGSQRAPVHDVLIIGAGPCGLAVAARLCERTPSAIFTDDEHHRYHWIGKHGQHVSLKDRKNGNTKHAQSRLHRRPSTLVLDSSGDEWMANWNHLFKTFEITHLRSPMFFHVDPADRDSLLAHTHQCHKEGELREICNCVGKDISKHKRKKLVTQRGKGPKPALEIDERERKDYFTPSTALFATHCNCIVDRYGLREGLVRKETVQDIDFGVVAGYESLGDIFTVKSEQNTHFARTVVLAVGAGSKPSVPPSMHLCMSQAIGHIGGDQLTSACHSMQIRQFPDPAVMRKINNGRATNVLVVGGGLTSAQIADLALRRGVTRVWHIMRGDFKVKPFDVDLKWMGKFRNFSKAEFWSANDDSERLEAIQEARNGGSINPPYAKIVKQHVATGRVSLHTNTKVFPQHYDPEGEFWTVKTEPALEGIEDVQFDYIYFATGVQADFEQMQCLQTIQSKFPIHGHGGLPCLGEDLEWWGNDARGNSVVKHGERQDWQGRNGKGDIAHKRVPLFVTGRLAGLRLGPGAGNLEGARVGAERVVLGIQEYLSGLDGQDTAADDDCADSDRLYRYAAGIGSRFDTLNLEFEDLFE